MKAEVAGRALHVEPGFEPVAEAFDRALRAGGGVGQACAVVVEGRIVVDLWAGTTGDGRSWQETMRSPVFSVSKGVTAICLLMAADRGLLDLDAPVADLWPEFGAHGKDRVSVREALAHRAGVPAFSRSMSRTELADWELLVADLADAAPLWEPGRRFLYHAVTVGFLAGEVLRRASGRRPGQWLADEIVDPLDLTMSYCTDVGSPSFAAPFPASDAELRVPLAADEQELHARAMLAEGVYAPDIFTAAGTAAMAIESPAASLVTTARDLARLYGATVHGERPLLDPATVAAASVPMSSGTPFVGPDMGDVWGTGFMVASARRGMAGPGSFGHDGAGGQLAFAHPGHRLGFGYQTLRPGGVDDDRAEDLCRALRGCL